jgi:hypothetical protein
VRKRIFVTPTSEVGTREDAMVNRAAYKGEKRQKEIARLKKAEEKRLRRLAKRASGQPDTDGDDDADDATSDEPSDAPTDEPAKTT